MSYTGRDFVSDALREIGVTPASKKASGTELATALDYAQSLMDAETADRMNLYTVLRSPFTLTSLVAHTIGLAGATFTGNRPIWVPGGTVTPVGSDLEIPLHAFSRAEWEDIRQKTQTDSYPHAFFYQPTTDLLGTFWFFCVPTTAATVTLSIPVPLQSITANVELAFPPGYKRFLRLGLALDLCRPFRVPTPERLVEDHFFAKQLVQANNQPGPPDSRTDADFTAGRYDIFSNNYRGRP